MGKSTSVSDPTAPAVGATSNVQRPTSNVGVLRQRRSTHLWTLSVGRWTLDVEPRAAPVALLISILLSTAALAQPAAPERFQRQPPDPAMQPVAPRTSGKIDFIGARAFTPDKLREPLAEQIKEIDEQGLTKPRADDTAYYLAVFYRKQGYPNVEVNWEIRGARLLLKISEGPRTTLRHVTFSGNRAVNNTTLFEYMIGGTEERLQKQPTQSPFVEADVQNGMARIRGLYESLGYLDAQIADAVISYSGSRTLADVQVGITEGKRYLMGDIAFVGDTVFPRDRLLGALGEPLSSPFTTQRLNTMQHNLEFFYKAEGHYAADVSAAADPKTATPGPLGGMRVAATFTVKAGPQYRFDGVTVTWNQKEPHRLRDSFIQQRLRGLKGEVYSPAKLDEKHRELLRTGLFRNLRPVTTPLPSNEVRVDFVAEEAKAKEVGFSIGFSSYEGFILGTRLADRNLNGNGRPLSLDLEYSQRALRAELLYVDPWLFESNFQLRSRLYAQSREEEGYAKRESGFRADLTREVTKNIQLGTFLQLENVEITESQIVPSFLGATAYQIATIGLTQSFDFRNSPVNPSRGWVINTALDFDTIAGDVAFGRGTVRLSYYRPVFRSLLLAVGVRGGLIYPLTSVPIDERFFLGGSTTVRSFRERQLGPRDPHDYPVGGEAFTVFNAELDFPIRDALTGAVFVDAGNLIARFQDAGFNDLRFGIGAGLRYKLPIGPIRLDVGLNPSPKRGEDWGAVHFSFGFAF